MKKMKLFFVLTLSVFALCSFIDFTSSGPGKIYTKDDVGIGVVNPLSALDIMAQEGKDAGVLISSRGKGNAYLNLFTARPDETQSIWSGTAGSGNQGWNLMARNIDYTDPRFAGNLYLSYWDDSKQITPLSFDHKTGFLGIRNRLNPAAALDVNGDIKFNSTLLTGTDKRLNIYSNSNFDNSRSWIELWGDHEQRAGELALAGTYISLRTNSTTSGGGTERMRITSDGRFGLGTSKPLEQFQLGDKWTFHDGGSKFIGYNVHWQNSAQAHRRIADGAASQLRFESDGSLTLQTAAPGSAGESPAFKIGMTVQNNGQVGFGTDQIPNGFKLAANGKIICEELQVQLSQNWPDYVFADDYELPTLEEVSRSIKENGHLPGLPSAKEIEANGGFEIGEMQRLMMEKMEEMTLYMIDLKEKNEALQNRVNKLETRS